MQTETSPKNDPALADLLNDIDAYCQEFAANPPRPYQPTPAERHASIERMFQGVYRQLGMEFVPFPFAASQSEEPAPAPPMRQMASLEEARVYATKHGVPFHQAMVDLWNADLAKQKPIPAIVVQGDLRTSEEPALARRQLENQRPRRSVARDRRSSTTTEPFYEEELSKRGRSLVRNPIPSNTSTNTIQNTRRIPPSANENVPAWKETGTYGKLVGMHRAIALNDNGDAWAFTLNLSPDVIARALASKHNGFASFLQKRIAAELSKALKYPVEFVFAVDVTRKGRPHLHGMIAVNDNERPVVEEALKRAGGAWKAALAHRQVDTRLAWDVDGWTSYSARNLAAARKVVGNSVIAGTGRLRTTAKDLHEHLRRLSRTSRRAASKPAPTTVSKQQSAML